MKSYTEQCTFTYDENGALHSHDDKPAMVTPTGSKLWYKHGLLHRENGPAVIFNKTVDWYLGGKQVSDVVEAALKNEGIDRYNLSDEEFEYVCSYPAIPRVAEEPTDL